MPLMFIFTSINFQRLIFGSYPPKRYVELFERTNESFWNSFSSCYQSHLSYSRATRRVPKSLTEGAGEEFGGTSCLDRHTASHYINSSVITSLPDYDIFILEKVMAVPNWIPDSKDKDCRVMSFPKYQARYQGIKRFCQFHHAARNYTYLTQFCQNGSACDANQIDNDLSNLASKIHFIINGFVIFLC